MPRSPRCALPAGRCSLVSPQREGTVALGRGPPENASVGGHVSTEGFTVRVGSCDDGGRTSGRLDTPGRADVTVHVLRHLLVSLRPVEAFNGPDEEARPRDGGQPAFLRVCRFACPSPPRAPAGPLASAVTLGQSRGHPPSTGVLGSVRSVLAGPWLSPELPPCGNCEPWRGRGPNGNLPSPRVTVI